MGILLRVVVGTVLVLLVARQCRRPAWFLGRLAVRSMNRTHAAVTAWGLAHLTIDQRATILDVGCGGGQTVDTLASIATKGLVYGVDYSPASVATARQTNAARIAAGTVSIQLASVSHLPFRSNTFDVVTAIETHYYWPNLHEHLREIHRVLKPGGILCIIAETYRGRRMDWLYRPTMAVLRATYLRPAEHRELFSAAGFDRAEVFEEISKGWIGATGIKVGD